jgi:hypothetical protein
MLIELKYDLDFYLAPKKVKVKVGEEEQIVDSGISGSWASLNNKVVIDQDLIYPGYDLGIESAEEGDILNKPFEEITVKKGVKIVTRKLEEGEEPPDYLNDSSAGDSGSILIQAERVYIEDGVEILAHVEEGSEYSAGDITIKSYAVGGTDFIDILPGVDIDHPQAIIEIGKNVAIKGKKISFTATANSEEIFHPDDSNKDLIDNGGEKFQWLHNLLNTTLGTALGFVEDFSLVGAVSVAKATSKISIGEGSLIESESFEALSSSYVEAAAAPIAIAAGVAVGVGIADAQVIVDGKIITAGDCTLKSLADNTLQVAGTSGGLKGISAGVAVSVLDSTSKVNIGDNAELKVGGNLKVEARTIDRNFTFARSTTDKNGKVGVAIAFSYENGITEAILGGDVDVEGDISVVAYATKEELGGKKLFVFPTENSGVFAYAGANTSSTGDISDDLKAKITGPITAFIKKHVKEFVNKYILDKKDQIEEQSGNTVAAFEAAAAIAAYIDTNNVTASISPRAVVRSRGSVNVRARAENQPLVGAAGSVEESQGGQDPGGGTESSNEGDGDEGSDGGDGSDGGEDPGSGDPDPEEETKFAGAAAIAVGVFANNVSAYIGENAVVDAAEELNVKAEFINDYIFKYGKELFDILFKEYYSTDDKDVTINKDDIVEVKDGHTEGGEAGHLYKYIGLDPLTDVELGTIDYTNTDLWEDLGAWWKYRSVEFIKRLTTYLDENLGATENLVNFWVESNAAGAKVGVCGSVSVVIRNNTVEAYIDKGAQINQIDDSKEENPVYRTGKQNVKVLSVLVDEIVYFSGNIELPGLELDTSKKYKFHLHLGGEGTDASTALGGSVVVFIQNNTSKAEIRDQVLLYADNLDVTADSKVLNVVVSAAGGKAEGFGLEGTFTWLTLNNQTKAQIHNGAQVVVPGKVLVKANDQTNIINVSGVITISASSSGNTGVGTSGGYNGVSRDTQAVIGVLLDSADGDMPADGVWTLDAGDVLVEAKNDGFIISVAVAGAVAGTKTDPKTENNNEKEAPQGGGKYGVGISAEAVVNNIQDTVLAYIRRAALQCTGLIITSHNRTTVIAVGGSAAIVTKEGKSAGLAGSFALNRIANVTKAFIDKSRVTATKKLEIKAKAEERIISVAASGEGTAASESGGLAGQVSINTIASEVIAANWLVEN